MATVLFPTERNPIIAILRFFGMKRRYQVVADHQLPINLLHKSAFLKTHVRSVQDHESRTGIFHSGCISMNDIRKQLDKLIFEQDN